MDLELKHLGQTLAIGGLAIGAFLALLRIHKKEWAIRPFSTSTEKLQLQDAAVYLALVFAAGIVIEDLSNERVSFRERGPFLAYPVNLLLKRNSDLRLEALFHVESLLEDRAELDPHPLFWKTRRIRAGEGVDPFLARLRELVPLPTPPSARGGGKAGAWASPDLPDGPAPIVLEGTREVRILREAVSDLFYAAKNRVYRDPNYFAELSGIAQRTDFVRSLACLTMVLGFAYLLYLLVYLMGMAIAWVRRRECPGWGRAGRLSASIAVLAVGCFLCRLAYFSESSAFNQRVFGYYVSILDDVVPGEGK